MADLFDRNRRCATNILFIWYTGGEFMIEDSSLYPVIAQIDEIARPPVESP